MLYMLQSIGTISILLFYCVSQTSLETETCSKGVGVDGPFIQYPTLDFNPIAFFALGAPIGKAE